LIIVFEHPSFDTAFSDKLASGTDEEASVSHHTALLPTMHCVAASSLVQGIEPQCLPEPLWNLAIKTVVLAGNPNVGKSVVFNAWTGQYAEVSNYPGTTVSLSKGSLLAHSAVTLIDSPGIYGLSSLSEEEVVAQEAILSADAVVNIVSALTLERDLFLTQQLIDWGIPLIVGVNQLDEAEQRGLVLDLERLSRQLGVSVLGCVATQQQGLEALMAQIPLARQGITTPELPAGEALRLLESSKAQQLKIYGHRRLYLKSWVKLVCQTPSSREAQAEARSMHWSKRFAKQLGLKLLSPWWGALSLVVALLSLYQLIGVWVAGDLVGLLEGAMVQGWVPLAQQVFKWAVPGELPLYGAIHTVLVGEFGLLTMTPRYIIGVLVPLVFGFNLYLALLEDCGYMPRLAALSDAVLRRVGLNGRAIVPLILGLGCVTMATISTRVLTSQKERTIANTLLAITIPCTAQLGVIMGMMAIAGGLKAWLVFITLLGALFIAIGTLLNQLIPGYASSLIIDLPPLRLPQLSNLAKKVYNRSISFIIEATPLFALGALLVSVAQVTGLLDWVQVALAGVTKTLLHLPKEAASAFIMGTVRRDFGLAGFYTLKNQLTTVQMMTALMVMTLFVPCIASATVMWKERGWREGAWVLLLSWTLAFSVGAVVTRLLEAVPILG
jgi:ferrous iron transport protein B